MSTFESSQETRREGLVKVTKLSLESFLLRLPWHNTQWCPCYCLSLGKNEKTKIELLPVLDRICFFEVEECKKKKTLKDNTKTPPSYTSPTHAVFLLSLHLVEFNSMSHLFHAVLSVLPSQSPPWCYFSPCLLSVFFSTPSSFLFGTWQFRCFFFLLSSLLDLFVPKWEKLHFVLFH